MSPQVAVSLTEASMSALRGVCVLITHTLHRNNHHSTWHTNTHAHSLEQTCAQGLELHVTRAQLSLYCHMTVKHAFGGKPKIPF